MSILFLIAFGIALALLVMTIIWPQVGLSIHMVGIMFGTIAIHHMGFQSGILYSLFGLLILGMLVFAFKEKVRFFPLSPQEIATIVLVVLMILSMAYTSTPDYGKDKILRFLGISFILVFACRIFGTTRYHMEKTLKVISWVSVFVLLFYVFLYVFARDILVTNNRFTGGTDSLILSWTAASAIVFVMYLLISDTMPWTKAFAGFMILCGMVVIIATGSRGPFLWLLIGSALTFLGRKNLIRSFFALVIVGIISLVALFYFAPEEGRERILTGLQGSRALDKSGRSDLYIAGLRQYLSNPVIGGGVGSFARYSGHSDERYYCHNMFLEIAGEHGTVGLLPIAVMFIFCIRPMLRLRSKAEPSVAPAKIIQLLFWVGLGNAMLSFDIPDQRILFAALGFLAAVRQWPTGEEYLYNDYEVYPELAQVSGEGVY